MKQQVNFYTEQFKPKQDLLSLQNMLVIWFAGIIAIFVLYSFELDKAEIAHNSWLMTQKREQHQQKQLESLRNSFASRGDAVVLEKTLQDLQANLLQRDFVLDQLGLKEAGMQKGVAGLLKNLASLSFKGLWLTDIQVNEGQLSVSGMTINVEKIPQLIQQLQNIKALQDKRFVRLAVKTEDEYDGLLSFTLQSENQVNNQKQQRRGH